MAKFTYSSGARPLDGYVIKRGIGQGGFGEVYYAVSEGGKEVALKLVRGNQDIELRGMAQCLNLKHSNLVTLFDIKSDAEGDAWVIMEYVTGESLSDVIHQHSQGMALEMARHIMLDLCKAIGYLHDHGIVHRDLKPANIFLENGQVKVGDYGLSKSISGTRKSPQTQSVGTVHYMAPEISTGNYGKQIDVYAAGVMLYEMIIGRPPFDGDTAGEILMKHLTATPDVSVLPPGYRQIVAKALAKNPSHRYATMDELAKELMALGSDASPLPETAPYMPDHGPKPVLPTKPVPVAQPVTPTAAVPFYWRTALRDISHTLFMATVWSFMISLLWLVIDAPQAKSSSLGLHLGMFNVLVISSWAVLIAFRIAKDRLQDPWLQRSLMLCVGVGIGLATAWLFPTVSTADVNHLKEQREVSGPSSAPTRDPSDPYPEIAPPSPPSEQQRWESLQKSITHFGLHAAYFGICYFALGWFSMMARQREKRFSLMTILWVGLVAWLISLFWSNIRGTEYLVGYHGVIVMMLTSVVVQLVRPWEPAPLKVALPRRIRYL